MKGKGVGRLYVFLRWSLVMGQPNVLCNHRLSYLYHKLQFCEKEKNSLPPKLP
jgi:hypothetical protein